MVVHLECAPSAPWGAEVNPEGKREAFQNHCSTALSTKADINGGRKGRQMRDLTYVKRTQIPFSVDNYTILSP